MTYDAPLDLDDWWQSVRWQLARETGWTLDYIDSLPLDEITAYQGIMIMQKELRED